MNGSVDYEETFSPVADIRAIRILIAIAAYYDYEIWQMDVKTAFWNGFLEEEIYMEQPEGFIDPNHPRKVCKLQISIYGLKQASRSWNKRFDEEIKKDRSRRLIRLSQNAYLDKILKRYKMDNSKRGSILMQVDLHLSKSQCATTSIEMKCMQNVPYASAVGSIMYTQSYELTVIVMLDSKPIEMTRNLKLAAKEAVWIRKFIDELGVVSSNDYPIKMNCDNSAAISWPKNQKFRKPLDTLKENIIIPLMKKRHYDRRVNKRMMQTQESKVVLRKALDANLVVMESNEIESGKQDTSSSSGNNITHAVDADIRPVNNQVPFAELQLTAKHNVLANEEHHTEQSEPIYDTYLFENVDINTTPNSTNMSHRRGEIDQDAKQYQVKSPLLNIELVKSKEMIEKEKYNELSHKFLLLEKHCISLGLGIQQKDASFQSNKPCKNQDAPDFCEFFEINDLKAQLKAKTTLICNLKDQIKSVKEASNEAKVKNDIDVIKTINIELEHSVAKLLAANEQLHKENEHLKQTYKELYDSIKKTRVQNKDNSDSLISQINQKSIKNVI
nr:retrotransposon protein, putative, Ty1-copia subclass [Tanacetum cinerariifolium]